MNCRALIWGLFALLLLLPFAGTQAADAVIRDAGSIVVGGVTYRLVGIDAPSVDQMCINGYADPWACGVAAREKLTQLVGSRAVHCDDLGQDGKRSRRRIGLCTAKGETFSLNRALVREGFALGSEPEAAGRFREDEDDARTHQSGLWGGCFVAPQEFRRKNKTASLLGASCRSDKDREIRAALFPTDLTMPPGCPIKAKLATRARVTGQLGYYQLQGCRAYETLTKPDRWFCSEEDAQTAGFHRAYNCRPRARR
jgi:endonuclease YncB( thermonuclease family)